MGQMIVITPEGIASVESKDKVTLEEVQKQVGGYIEAVPYFDRWSNEKAQVWCNEEGKLMGLSRNNHATDQWNANLKLHYGIEEDPENPDWLVGNIVILTGSAMLD